MIKINNLEKYYMSGKDPVQVLKNIKLNINKGEFISIMGPSGSGKTTLLNTIGLLDSRFYGNLQISNNQIEDLKTKQVEKVRLENIGYIFQEYNLIDTLTAYDNIALALSLKKVKNYHQIIEEYLQLLDIKECKDNYPHQLSGGQKQRVAIARALVNKPNILLCDEPTGALDQKNGEEVINYLQSINESLGITIVLVTHDVYVASKCNRVIYMKDGQIWNEIKKDQNYSDEDFVETLKQNERIMRSSNEQV